MLKPVQVAREGDTLIIKLPWYSYIWGFLTSYLRPRASISLPELRELRLSGASRAEVDGFTTTHDFSLDVTGASKLKLGAVAAGNTDIRLVGASELKFKRIEAAGLKMDIAGASHTEGEVAVSADARLKIVGASRIVLSGTVKNLNLDVSGASQVRLAELSAHNAKVKLAGASKAVVRVDGHLDADLAGASDLSWIGNPLMGDVRSVGASQLRRA